MMFVYRFSPEKASFFLLFFAVYVGCAVIAHKIDGLAGADPSMPLSNSRERGLKLFFQDYSRGFFAASCRSCQAFFISADSRTFPNFHLKISFLYILYGF